jgi:hypothetical protein
MRLQFGLRAAEESVLLHSPGRSAHSRHHISVLGEDGLLLLAPSQQHVDGPRLFATIVLDRSEARFALLQLESELVRLFT